MGEREHEGMTLRDYFAAKAMQGLLSGPRGENFSLYPDECADEALKQADVMLSARGKGGSAVSTELQEELSALKALIAKSSLIEVVATKCVDRGGHPVIVTDGMMLVHKDWKAREDQRTKDVQQLAAKSRELAVKDKELATLRTALGDPDGKLTVEAIEQAFFNHDSDGSEPAPGQWEERRDQWRSFKAYLAAHPRQEIQSERTDGGFTPIVPDESPCLQNDQSPSVGATETKP